MEQAGYSTTPLAKKLGIKTGCRLRLVKAPGQYFELFTDWPDGVKLVNHKKSKKNIIHYFTTAFSDLQRDIAGLKNEIEQDGMIWISWPKKASKVPTDITEDLIRALALANGLVDVKVCAVDEVWSGLKLVIPVKYRMGMG